jgi:hypothetical protein
MTIEKMKDEIKSGFKALGVDINFDADADLDKFRRGKPLTLRELRALPADAIVYVWYKEHGERGPRIDQAMRASREDENGEESWSLSDGSSFGAGFKPTGKYDHEAGKFLPPPDDAECFDESCGEGEMFLYHAVAVVAEKRAKKTAKKRSRR